MPVKQEYSLVCTLGSEPQVVTASLDLLLRRGERISEVVVVHTSANQGAIRQAIDALEEDFSSGTYGRSIPLKLAPILINGQPVEDVRTPQENSATFQALYCAIYPIKKKGGQLHFSIAGGRKNMAVYGMAAAQMLFDEHDHLWHLYSEGDFLSSRRLHPKADEKVQLIEIPVLLRDYISPALTGLQNIENAEDALAYMQRLNFEKKLADSRDFIYNDLTPAQRRVVTLLVQEGLGDQEIAQRLCISSRTVERHLRSAYHRAAQRWGLAAVSRTQLVSLLGLVGAFLAGEQEK